MIDQPTFADFAKEQARVAELLAEADRVWSQEFHDADRFPILLAEDEQLVAELSMASAEENDEFFLFGLLQAYERRTAQAHAELLARDSHAGHYSPQASDSLALRQQLLEAKSWLKALRRSAASTPVDTFDGRPRSENGSTRSTGRPQEHAAAARSARLDDGDASNFIAWMQHALGVDANDRRVKLTQSLLAAAPITLNDGDVAALTDAWDRTAGRIAGEGQPAADEFGTADDLADLLRAHAAIDELFAALSELAAQEV